MSKEFYSIYKNIIKYDHSFVIKNFISNPLDYVSWEDVESTINSNKYYIELIDNGIKKQIPQYNYFWNNHVIQDKKYIFDSINSGNTFVINQFSTYNNNISALVKNIEDIFPVLCDVHVYGGLKLNSKSFDPHIDIPSNFIIQIDGTTNWKIYKNYGTDLINQESINSISRNEILDIDYEVTLSPGDMIYIPSRRFHAAFPSSKRLSISIPCKAKQHNQSLNNLDRNYYTFNYD